jgi:hypothetical protein
MALTTNFQLLKEEYVGNATNGHNIYLRIYAKVDNYDIANNKTKTYVKSVLYDSASGGYWWTGNTTTKSLSCTNLNSVSGPANGTYYTGETILCETSGDIYHNLDGKKTISISANFTSTPWGWNKTISATAELPTIPRAATLTAAPNFNDEENPTITYSNPAGNAVTSLKACIANSTGSVVYAEYRDISKTGTSYTFNLTDEERNALRWASINSPNLTVKFYVTTVIGGVTYYSTLDKIMTITNAHPTLTAAVEDVGGTSVSLTGDKNKIIKGFNYITASMTATALKGASIKSQTITNGSKTLTAASGNFENVESGTFVFTTTDSRGYATTQTIIKELIEYIKLTCNMDVDNPNIDGETTLKISGNYFNGSFGKVANTLQVQYRYKESDGNYSEWIDAEFTLSNNTYNSTIDITGLNYKKSYTFQARAIDKVYPEVVSIEKKVKSIPVFDWGENDFNFNVPAYDKNGNEIGTELTANDYDAVMKSGKSLLESGWVTITPKGNSTPTEAYITFKRHYNKKPVVLVTASSGVIGSQVLGASTNGITNDGANLVTNRTNTTPTTIYYYVFGEVEE